MNKKGFIISTTLYGIFGIMLITIATILFVMSSNRTTVDAMNEKVKMCIEECNTPEDICGEIDNPTPINKIVADNILNTKKTDFDNCKSGLFADMDNDGLTFFFRGNVNNNYMIYGKDKSGNDLLWRVLRVNGDGTLRLILNENIKYYLIDDKNNKVDVKDGDIIGRIIPAFNSSYPVDSSPNVGYVFHSSSNLIEDQRDKDGNKGNYYLNYNNVLNKEEYSFKIYPNLELNYNDHDDFLTNSFYSFNNLYNKILKNWLTNDTSLGNLYKGKFCNTNYYTIYGDSKNGKTEVYLKNEDFKCDNNVENAKDADGNNTLVNSNIGFLSYGEYNQATCNGGNYFDGDGFTLSTFKEIRSKLTTYKDIYIYHTGSIDSDISIGEYNNVSSSAGQTEVNYCENNNIRFNEYDFYCDSNNNGIDDDDTKVYSYYWNPGDSQTITLRNVRPVINLSADTLLTGTGTIDNPYKIAS